MNFKDAQGQRGKWKCSQTNRDCFDDISLHKSSPENPPGFAFNARIKKQIVAA